MEKITFSYLKDDTLVEEKILNVLTQNDLWKPGDKKYYILKNSGVDKLFEYTKLFVKDFQLLITPTEGNFQQHGVLIWVGYENEPKGSWIMATGEASRFNTGKTEKTTDGNHYKEFGDVSASYRLAMAEKRAKARAVVRKLGIHGVYTEAEAPEFDLTDVSVIQDNLSNWI